jgi:hypothetical protein
MHQKIGRRPAGVESRPAGRKAAISPIYLCHSSTSPRVLIPRPLRFGNVLIYAVQFRTPTPMPIREFLDGHRFDPEVVRVIGTAFEIARASLQRADRGDSVNILLAQKIIALAEQGERDPERMADRVLAELRTPPPMV